MYEDKQRVTSEEFRAKYDDIFRKPSETLKESLDHLEKFITKKLEENE